MDLPKTRFVLQRSKLCLYDVAVISLLWCIEFFNIWISSLCSYTSFVFFTPVQLHSKHVGINDLSVFAVTCLGALTIAFLVDIGHLRKMVVSMVGLGLFALTPFVGLFTTMSNSPSAGMIMVWTSSVLFITLPVTYCLMFNQRLNANFTQVRRIVSVLELGNAFIGWAAFVTLPVDLNESSRYSVVFMWVITIPLLVALLTLIDSVRHFVRGDFTIDKSVKSMVEGIRSDFHEKQSSGRSVRHVVFFSLLLLPALSLTAQSSALDVSAADFEKPHDPVLVNLLYGFQMLIIPVIEVILALTHMREDRADYSILILAHVTNVIVLVLIVTNFSGVPDVTPTHEVEQGPLVRIKRGEHYETEYLCPKNGESTYLMLNGYNGDIEVAPSVTLKSSPPKWKIGPGKYYSGRTKVSDEGLDVVFHIKVLDPSLLTPQEARSNIELTSNVFHLMYVVGNKTFITLKHYGHSHNDQPGKALIMIMSTMWLDVDGGQITINSGDDSYDGSYVQHISVPSLNHMTTVSVPVSAAAAEFTYQFRGSDSQAKRLLTRDTISLGADSIPFERLSDYVVYLLLLGSKRDTKLTINAARVCNPLSPTTEAPTTTVSPSTGAPSSTKRPPNVQEITAYALAGSALGVTSVAYTHFFWVESPIRLRATTFALFRVANVVVYRCTPLLTGKELTLTKIYSLLSLQVFTTIAHLVLGWIFQTRITSKD